jgi:hypothetical protein
VRICFVAYSISARFARQWRPCGETGEVTRILRQLQIIRFWGIHLKNEGLQILTQIAKVPADLNAQLAKIKFLHLLGAPLAWAINAEPAHAEPEKNRSACVYQPLWLGRKEVRLVYNKSE